MEYVNYAIAILLIVTAAALLIIVAGRLLGQVLSNLMRRRELRHYKELLDKGTISQKEFTLRKKEIYRH